MKKPDKMEFEKLADLAEGRLPSEEARSLEEQLAGADEAARADLEWLRAFRRASEGTVIEPMPAGVREELVRRFEAYAEGVRPPGLLERVVATLRFDGGMQPAFGVRSAGADEGQFVYSTGAADIALSVRLRPGGLVDLDGQILPNDGGEEAGVYGVQLLSGGAEVDTTATDDLGEFAFEELEPGTYEVSISGDDVEIQILALRLHDGR